MATREQYIYEGFLSSHRVNLRIIQSKITIDAENRRTKKVYRTEVDQDAISTMTQGVCESCEHLFELLQELIENDGKYMNKSLEIVEQESKLILHIMLSVVFGRTSRQFNMQFNLEGIQLDDITRLENIINEHAQRLEQIEWSARDRFDHATNLTSLWINKFHFRNLSPNDHAIYSDNNRTIRCATITQQQTDHPPIASHFGVVAANTASTSTIKAKKVTVITNQAFLLTTNKRYQSIRFNLTMPARPINDDSLLIGVVYQPDGKEWSTLRLSNDVWLFNICNGQMEHSQFGTRPYTWPIRQQLPETLEKQSDQTLHIELLFDTHHRCLAYRLNEQTEDQWAFYLPKHLQIDQLYPVVILDGLNTSVSIAV